MTAEVAIVNRHAIALAADSAVTVGREKVWKTANKIFSLGPRHDIAIMVYGAGDYIGLAWDLIAKEFRRRAAAKDFRTVDECVRDFRDFLTTNELFGRKEQQELSVLFPVFDLLSTVKADDLEGYVSKIRDIRSHIQAKDSVLPNFDSKNFESKFTGQLKEFLDGHLEWKMSQNELSEVAGLASDFFSRKITSRYNSGIVIAGFGADEFYPALAHHIVDGYWDGNLRWWEGDNSKNLNTKDHFDEFPIVPFAQDDMSFQFMAGISTDYLSFIRASLTKVMTGAFDDFVNEFVPAKQKNEAKTRGSELAKDLASSVMDGLYQKVREEQFIPINRAVGALPKEEMALMAESLVDLTSLKRKVDSQLESVAGPVDVAVISKGDGFVWIKRKYYFDPERNGDFFARRSMREKER